MFIWLGHHNVFTQFVTNIENSSFDLRQAIISKYNKPREDIVIIAVDDASYEYIMNNEDTIFAHHMQARATYCASLLNSKGGVVELSTWDENDVERYLDQHKHEIVLQDND